MNIHELIYTMMYVDLSLADQLKARCVSNDKSWFLYWLVDLEMLNLANQMVLWESHDCINQ